MSGFLLKHGLSDYVSGKTLVVLLQTNLYVNVIDALHQHILHCLHAKPDLEGLVIDLSQMMLLDLDDMHVFKAAHEMACIYGVEAYLVGIRPEVAMALAELGYDGKMNTALTVEQAIEAIRYGAEVKRIGRMQHRLKGEIQEDEGQQKGVTESSIDD